MCRVTKIFKFEASHRLPYHKGNCFKLHGHSYKLEVTVGGNIEQNVMRSDCGMIIDFKDLKKIVEEVAINKYDHSYLNDFFNNPTAENMVKKISFDIMNNLPKNKYLVSCKLWETDTSYAEYIPKYKNGVLPNADRPIFMDILFSAT